MSSLSAVAREERNFRDREAEHYDSYIPSYQHLAEWATYERLLPSGSSFVVDVGCGTGRFAAGAAARCDHLLGIDFALAALLVARKRSPSNCRFVVGDALQLPVRDACADVVFSSQVLEHIVDPNDARRFFSEVGRVLHSDGRVVVSTYALSLFDRLLGRKADLKNLPRSVRWTHGELRSFCATAGLQARRFRDFAVFSRSFAAVFRKWLAPSTLARWDGWLSSLGLPWAALTVVSAEKGDAYLVGQRQE